ncbi:hypothetical protein [Novosphingobium sp. MBES04]|uniref:hypothetical protein n=1 Tax=Novosphingobium sp. MBES04 TaxID=1206458 RepID=UPI00057C517B|nr:hypothetical protein [Novosphingobium sp. MBES04]GAM06345.1 hypothetical conserved protein [Novosphingobium sp. MBES04]
MIRITSHAITRAMERLPGIQSEAEAIAALDTPAVQCAAEFAKGAKVHVKRDTGQRIVIEDGKVTTVLPPNTWKHKLGTEWDRIRQHARGWARFCRGDEG